MKAWIPNLLTASRLLLLLPIMALLAGDGRASTHWWAFGLFLLASLTDSLDGAAQGFCSMTPCLGVVIGTGRMSKLKLVFQLVAAGTALAGLRWDAAAPVLRVVTWLALGLALLTGGWSMVALFRDNADLWTRLPLPMERR